MDHPIPSLEHNFEEIPTAGEPYDYPSFSKNSRRQSVSKAAHVQPQFEDMEQQTHTVTLGMWTFLATEILFFGVLFVSYTMLRMRWQDAFRHGSEELKLWIGGANTAILLTSSTFMALAVRAAKMGNQWLMIHLAITVPSACLSSASKPPNIISKQKNIWFPRSTSAESPPKTGQTPRPAAPAPQKRELFMGFYFIMTAFHALHMIVGISVLAVLIVLAKIRHFSANITTPWKSPDSTGTSSI